MSRLNATPGQVRLDDLIQVCRSGAEIDTALLMEMLGLFIEENTRRLAAAREAARLGSDRDLRAAVHALKGSAALVGANHLRNLAADFEDEIVKGTTTDAPAAIDGLDGEFAAVVATLRARYPKLASA